MPVVNREVVLPVPRERAWELITEPSELEGWLADEVEFEPEEDAPLRVTDGGETREGVVEEVAEQRADRVPLGRLARRVGARGPSGRHALPRHRAPLRRRHDHLGPEADGAPAGLAALPGVDDVFSALSDPTRREVLRSVARARS